MRKLFLTFAVVMTLYSCNTYKKVVYLQDTGQQIEYKDSVQSAIPDPILKTGDLINITVNTNIPEAAQAFNLPLIPGGEGMNSYGISKTSISGGAGLQNYLIDTQGYLTFPVIGKLKVSGLKKSQLVNLLKTSIYPKYMKEEPIITVRFANYKVSVLGEVNRPGAYQIDNEKVTIIDALATAGDLTIYGRRDNILLLRESENGTKTTYRIDLRDKRLIYSEFYYLEQNDVIYVQPNNPRARGSALGAAEAITVSVVGTLISLTSLIINVIK